MAALTCRGRIGVDAIIYSEEGGTYTVRGVLDTFTEQSNVGNSVASSIAIAIIVPAIDIRALAQGDRVDIGGCAYKVASFQGDGRISVRILLSLL